MYDKKTVVRKRYKVKELYFKQHFKKSEIARKLRVSRSFIDRWTEPGTNPKKDNRGWSKGKYRYRSKQEERRVVKIRKELIKKKAFFFGPDKVRDEYIKRYPNSKVVSRSFVTRVIYDNFPESRRSMLKAVKEQRYPLKTLQSLGEIHEGIDFIGHKFLKGRSQPIHFFTRVYSKPFVLRLIKRVKDQSMATSFEVTSKDWKHYPIPDCLWMDNGFGFVASGRSARIISPFIQYLLILGIRPIFIAPKKPWMNGAVEGTNSVFAKKVWKKYHFSNPQEIDQVLGRFEKEYRIICPLPETLPGSCLDQVKYRKVLKKPLDPQPGMAIYLIRLVELHDDCPAIRIFKELIQLEKQYLNTYMLVKVDVYQQKVGLYIETDSNTPRHISDFRFNLRFAKLKM